MVPPPGADPFVAPTLVGTALVGCRYDGDHWTVTFRVTVRGGSSWNFADSNAQTMPFIFTVKWVGTGSGGTSTATYEQPTPQWISGGGAPPDHWDEPVRYYALTDKHAFRPVGVELPQQYRLTAHCTR